MSSYCWKSNDSNLDISDRSDFCAALVSDTTQFEGINSESRRKLNRSQRRFKLTTPYSLHILNITNHQQCTESSDSVMEGDNHVIGSLNPFSETPKHNVIQFTDPTTMFHINEQHIPMGIETNDTTQCNACNCTASGIFLCAHQNSESDPQTVVIEGKTYALGELLSIIKRFKHEARMSAERIKWLEHELYQARTMLTQRDQDIHKLRSVLDQKVPVAVLPGGWLHAGKSGIFEEMDQQIMENDQKYTRDAFFKNTLEKSMEIKRVKKQGVSGESQTQKRMSGIIQHPKDLRDAQIIRQAIDQNDFLRHLGKAQVEEIVNCMYKKHIAEGAYVIREGNTGDALYVVAEGVLEVSKSGQILGRMEVGRAFGELALLYNCNRTASVRAVTKSSAWTLDRHIFQQIMMSSYMQDCKEKQCFLQSVPVLKTLSPEKMHKLVDVLETVYYGPDEYIIREGEIGETFFILQSGTVRVTKSFDDSEEKQEIRKLYKGDWFGEKALYTSDKRSANVISITPGVQLLSLDRSNFIHLIGDLNEIRSKDYGEDANNQSRVISTSQLDVEDSAISDDLAAVQSEFGKQIQMDELERVAVLGTGGFGCVELVIWVKDKNVSFALKRMKKQHIVQTRQQEHICSERRILLQVRSPFICRLYRTYRDNKYVYMLLEPCLGGEIWTLLRNRGRFTDLVTRFIVACALEAFTYLHTHGIIYRDLKPENLLLNDRGYVKLCDFGFAKRLGQGRKTWTFCGTPEYVAPEIILNRGHDYSADYWSLGILIFELLTGSPPFTGSDPMKIYNVVLRGIDAVEFSITCIHRTAATLIKRLCAHNPTQRLGYGIGGVVDIKQNKYFQGFDWIGLHRGTFVSPLKPTVNGPCDVSNFDSYPDRTENPPDELSGWDAEFDDNF